MVGKLLKTLFGIVAVLMVIGMVAGKKTPTAPMPDDERRLCAIVAEGKAAFRAADRNQIQEDAAKGQRAGKLNGLSATAWVGTLERIETTASSGDAYIAVRLPCDVETTLKTWNNALSDVSDKTMVAKGSPVYDQLGLLKKGASVQFSADLIMDKTGAMHEASMTTQGSMTEPEFIARFSTVQPL